MLFFTEVDKPRDDCYKSCKTATRRGRCRKNCRQSDKKFSVTLTLDEIEEAIKEEIETKKKKEFDIESTSFCLSFDYRNSVADVIIAADSVVSEYPTEPCHGRWQYAQYTISPIDSDFQVNTNFI